LGTPLTRAERFFLMWMAPRGIVAASVASVFAFELTELAIPDAELLSPLIFLVIVGTVVFYGLTSGPVARRLGLAERRPQGALIIGAHPFARQLAAAMRGLGYRALLVDSNHHQVVEGQRLGLEVHHGNALSEETLDDLDFGGLWRVLALTDNDEVNALSGVRYREFFGRAETYRLPSPEGGLPGDLGEGRVLFDPTTYHDFLTEALEDGATVTTVPLSADFSYANFQTRYGERAIPLCLATENGRLHFFAADARPTPKAGDQLVSLILPEGSNGQS
jgi:hypothetical protein